MFGNLEKKEIEELLNSQIIGRLGCHADGLTYVVPMSYAYDGEYIYGHTLEGMKVNIMRKNPQVCFEVDSMQDMANWKSVVGWGVFEELKSEQERNAALKHLVDRVLPIISSETTHLSPQWPFPAGDPKEIKGIVFRIKLVEKTGRFESNATAAYIAG
jgi:nitroimidazol reductase NimA-like FMN-containing flavoprotein (pyridoxamine 5'-phosphate oxidase superfamily)